MPTLAEQLEWWTKQAAHDIEAGKSNRQHNFHDARALMCQQAAEKFLKALFMKVNQTTPPKIHNCEQLAKLLGAPPNVALAARLVEADYMECRYPDAAQGVPFEQFTDTHSEQRLTAAEEVKTWVLEQLNAIP